MYSETGKGCPSIDSSAKFGILDKCFGWIIKGTGILALALALWVANMGSLSSPIFYLFERCAISFITNTVNKNLIGVHKWIFK